MIVNRIIYMTAAISVMVLSGCSQPISDSIGQPYTITLEAKQDTVNPKLTQISALVDYGGFGFVQSTVELLDGFSVISNLTELEGAPPTTNEAPHIKRFQKSISLNSGTEYNLKARVKWMFQGAAKTLDSTVVKFKPAQ